MDFDEPSTFLWIAAGTLLLVAAVAAYAEHRRTRRRNLDRPGCMSWNLIQVLAFLLAVIAGCLALLV